MADGGGASLGRATGVVAIETEFQNAAAQVQRVSQQIEQQFARINQSTSRAEAGLGGFKNALGALAGGFGIGLGVGAAVQAVIQLAQATDLLAQAAVRNRAIAASFDELAASVGENSEDMLAAMQETADGLISNADLILNANRALITGAADTTGEITALMEVAQGRARALGLSTSETFERLVQGIGKREKELLDELGIVINLNDVYDRYAEQLGTTADALSEAEKSQAFLNAVLQDSTRFIGDAGGEAENAADTFGRYDASVQNLKDSLGELFAVGATENRNFWASMIEGLTSYVDAWNEARAAGVFGGGMGLPPLGSPAIPGPIPGVPGGGMPTRGTAPAGGVPDWMTGVPRSASGPLRSMEGIEAERAEQARKELEAARDYDRAISQLNRQTDAKLLDENETYQQRRVKMEADYQENLTEAASSYAISRQRSIDAHEKDVARSERDYQARRTRMAEDHAREMESIEQEHHDRLADAAEAHGRRLADLQENLERTLADRQEQYDERVADMAEDRDKALSDAQSKSAERVQELTEDHNEQLTDAATKSAQRLADIEEDYARQRERAAREHGETIHSAAMRNDGRAIYEENRRYAQEQKDAAEAHEEKVNDEQKALDEAIKNLNEAYSERLKDEQKALDESIQNINENYEERLKDEQEALEKARENANENFEQQKEDADKAYAEQIKDLNEQFGKRKSAADTAYQQELTDLDTHHRRRLSDMATDFGEELAQRDNDQIDRINKMKTHHTQDMSELDTQHGNRLAQITRHAGEERTKIDEEFALTLGKLGTHNTQIQAAEDAYNARAKKSLELFLAEQEKINIDAQLAQLRRMQYTMGTGTSEESEQLAESIARLEQASGETGGTIERLGQELDALPTVQEIIEGFLTLAAAAEVVSGAGGPGGITIGEIHIHGAATDSPEEFARRFRQQLIAELRAVKGAVL